MEGMRGLPLAPLYRGARSPWSAEAPAHASGLLREVLLPTISPPVRASRAKHAGAGLTYADATNQNVITDSPVPWRTRKISEDEARRIASNIAKLPNLLGNGD